jgi:hypothetical protein
LATQGEIVGDKKVLAEAEKLAKQLDTLYGEVGRAQRLQVVAKKLASNNKTKHLAELITVSENESEISVLQQLCNLLVDFRNTITTKIEPSLRLQILDIYPDIEAEIRLKASQQQQSGGLSRKSLLEIVNALAHASYGSGLLTKNELSSINSAINTVVAANDLPIENYYQASRIFNLASNWAIGTVRHTFLKLW